MATLISRLAGGFVSAFPAEVDAAKRLQRVNEAIDLAYELGTWRGFNVSVGSLTATTGIITLAAAYLKLEKLRVDTQEYEIPVKTVEWQYNFGITDLTKYQGARMAVDRGDNGSGLRQYQISGPTATTDLLTFTGLCRKRFTWISDTATVVIPDSFSGIKDLVLALNAKDRSDDARYAALLSSGLQTLSGNATEFEPTDLGTVQTDPYVGLGSVGTLV